MARMIKPGMDGKEMRQIAKTPGKPMLKSKKSAYDENQPPIRPNMNYKKKMTQAEDDADDRKHGIKEGSAKDLAIDKARGLRSKKKASPMIKPSRKGLLHRELGVAEGEKIPSGKLNQALNSKSPKIRKQANFARNFNK